MISPNTQRVWSFVT